MVTGAGEAKRGEGGRRGEGGGMMGEEEEEEEGGEGRRVGKGRRVTPLSSFAQTNFLA